MIRAESTADNSLAGRRACDELSRKLHAGHDCRAEEFLRDQPEIGLDSDAVLELLYTEFVVREQLGQQPRPQEWLARFPQWRAELAHIFEVHDLVGGGETHASARPGTHRDEPPGQAENAAAATSPRAIGGYEILQEIGRGGMGIVYQARQRGLDRIVALKMILSPHNERDRARFRAEAEATARLSHPNIVPIYEVGLDDGCPFLSMEFIGGSSLEKRLVEAVLAPRPAAELLLTLTKAVAYAHEQGIIHRDLKPANVLLSVDSSPSFVGQGQLHLTNENGPRIVPKITDFGLAKTLDADQSQAQSVAIVGTPSYMPPEQCAAGGSIGPAVDVYALGAILYEALTGRPPFRGPTALDILELVRAHDPVPPSRLAGNIPRDLETICLKCLAKLPEQRYPSALALAEDLRRFLSDEPIIARPISRVERAARWCRRNPAIAALVGGIALVLVIASVTSTALAVWALREKTRADLHAQQELTARQLAEEHFSQAENAVGKYLDGIESDPRLQEADFYTLRKDLLASAVPFYEDFVASKPGESELEAKRGRAYGRLGFIHKQIGELEKATIEYERMREIFVRLAAANKTYRRDLAQSQFQLGWTLADQGKLHEAETEYRLSLALYEQLASELPDDHSLAHRVAIGHRNLGMVWRELSRRAEAESSLREALERLEKLAVDHPEVARYQEDVAGLHTFLGNVLTVEPGGAREDHYRRSVEMYKALASQHPNRPEHRYGLATARNNLGALHTLNRQYDAALVELEQALELRKQMVADFPAVPAYQRLLATAQMNVGISLKGAKRLDESETNLRSAIELLEQLAANYPSTPDHRSNLAFAREEQASVLQALGRPAESERERRAALQLRRQIATEFPAVPLKREDLAKCHATLGATLYRVDRYQEAEAEFSAAITLRQEYANDFPDDQENIRQLALCLEQRAQALQRLNQRVGAMEAYRQATALWTDRLAESMSSSAMHFEAGRTIAGLAALLDKGGQLDEANRLYELAAIRHQQALDSAPTNPSYANALWKDYFELSSVNVRRKNHGAAAEAAVKLAAVRATSGEDAVWTARYFGRCVGLASQDTRLEESERANMAQSYADKAMEYLHEAIRRGYRDVVALTKLEALAPLSHRPDFQGLVTEPKNDN